MNHKRIFYQRFYGKRIIRLSPWCRRIHRLGDERTWFHERRLVADHVVFSARMRAVFSVHVSSFNLLALKHSLPKVSRAQKHTIIGALWSGITRDGPSSSWLTSFISSSILEENRNLMVANVYRWEGNFWIASKNILSPSCPRCSSRIFYPSKRMYYRKLHISRGPPALLCPHLVLPTGSLEFSKDFPSVLPCLHQPDSSERLLLLLQRKKCTCSTSNIFVRADQTYQETDSRVVNYANYAKTSVYPGAYFYQSTDW